VSESRAVSRRLARLRVPLGFVSAVFVLWVAQPTAATLAWGAAIAAAGESLRIWAAGHLHKAREVTASGPYRWLAHPLYVGSTVMGGGLAIASHSLIVTAIIAVYLAVTLTAAIKSEEAFLREAFGDAYQRYRGSATCVTTPRTFSLAQARANHEARAVVGLAVAVLLLILKATYNGSFAGR
jgi:protein-S-isoprenylcysteine O-methyltransferase Ste14